MSEICHNENYHCINVLYIQKVISPATFSRYRYPRCLPDHLHMTNLSSFKLKTLKSVYGINHKTYIYKLQTIMLVPARSVPIVYYIFGNNNMEFQVLYFVYKKLVYTSNWVPLVGHQNFKKLILVTPLYVRNHFFFVFGRKTRLNRRLHQLGWCWWYWNHFIGIVCF